MNDAAESDTQKRANATAPQNLKRKNNVYYGAFYPRRLSMVTG